MSTIFMGKKPVPPPRPNRDATKVAWDGLREGWGVPDRDLPLILKDIERRLIALEHPNASS